MWPLLVASGIITGMGVIYNAWKKDPALDMAQFIKGRQLEAAMKAARGLRLEEKVRGEFAQMRSERLQNLVETKQGLTEGWISPVELGIEGGGLSARDMPLVNLMAANLGMDPQDLVAKFDPTRSNFYTPTDRRGESITPALKQVLRNRGSQGPAQMNPMRGFGG